VNRPEPFAGLGVDPVHRGEVLLDARERDLRVGEEVAGHPLELPQELETQVLAEPGPPQLVPLQQPGERREDLRAGAGPLVRLDEPEPGLAAEVLVAELVRQLHRLLEQRDPAARGQGLRLLQQREVVVDVSHGLRPSRDRAGRGTTGPTQRGRPRGAGDDP